MIEWLNGVNMTPFRAGLLLFLIPFCAPVWAGDKTTVTLTSGHFPPWISTELPENGYLHSLITEAFNHSGYEVKWEFLPWKRALRQVREGRADGPAAWASHPERDKRFNQSIPVYDETNLLFRRRGTPPMVWDALQLQPHRTRVSIPLGYTVPALLEKLEHSGGIQLIEVRTASSSLRMLAEGRVQYAYDGLYSGLYTRAQVWSNGRAPVLPGELTLRRNQGHVLFNPNNPRSGELVRALNEGLRYMFRNGRALALKERLLMPMVSGLKDRSNLPAPPPGSGYLSPGAQLLGLTRQRRDGSPDDAGHYQGQ